MNYYLFCLRYAARSLLLFVSLVGWASAADIDQLIMKYPTTTQARMPEAELQARLVAAVSDSTGLQAAYKRPMSSLLGTHVLKLPYAMSVEDARLQAAIIMQSHPEFEYVEPDGRRYPHRTTPSDTRLAEQWYLQTPAQYAGAANVVNAWDVSKGSADVVVAVLDSGVTAHADLQANLAGGSVARAGYDFVSDTTLSNDGDGRDADPSDPGAPLDGVSNSVWHGTHVAGLVAARPNNARDIAGVGWNTRLLVVRILSAEGGSLSDQVDGMLWAAGESVPGVADNALPAAVLNLSLGTDYYEDCSLTEQAAVDALRKRGVSIVVSAGNENRNVEGSAPANCKGVLSVTGVMRDGARAPFANYGANTIAAPAQDILSLSNDGVRAPAQDSLYTESGTSQSAPQVAGVLALMLAANPQLRDPQVIPPATLPDLLADKLQKAARAFPATIEGSDDPRGCNRNQEVACRCTTATCGAGLLDAFRAVKAVSTAPTAVAGVQQTVKPGESVVLDGAASKDDAFGGRIVNYVWSQSAGTTVSLQDAETARAVFKAPTTAQTLRFVLKVTDDTGLVARATTTVVVATGSSGGSGGGGSPGVWLLMMLSGLLVWRRSWV